MEQAVNSLVHISSKMVVISSLLYLLAMVLYIFYVVFKNKTAGRFAFLVGAAGFLLHFSSFIIRWYEFYKAGDMGIFQSIPITNKYESLMFFALLLAAFYLVLEFKTKNKSLGVFAFAVAGSLSLFINAISASSHLNLLVPALKSNWLLAHVSLSFTAYVCFTIASIFALLYLIKTVDNKKRYSFIAYNFVLGVLSSVVITIIANILLGKNANTLNMVAIFLIFAVLFFTLFYKFSHVVKNLFKDISFKEDDIEKITYKFIAAGFAIFTIGGMVFGAIWAQTAWGRFWQWDAKETWTFITWMVYGIYLHGRLSNRWSKEFAATLALAGFLVVIFTFLGVNLLMSGLHSYGSI